MKELKAFHFFPYHYRFIIYCQYGFIILLLFILIDAQIIPELACKTPFIFFLMWPHHFGFSSGASDKEPTCQCRRHKRLGFDPWVEKMPWQSTWQPTPVFLPGESHEQRSLAGYSPWGCKELDMTKHACILFYIIFHYGLLSNIEYISCAIQKDFVVYPFYM